MKNKIICTLLALLTALMCSSCAASVTVSDSDIAFPTDTEVSCEPAVPATFEMTDSLSEQNARENGSGLSEDSPLNIYGFPLSEYPYFIYVEKGSHSITVYTKDVNGYYTVELACWPTATGSTDALTPTGVFPVGTKEKWHVWPSGYFSPYTTRFYDNEKYGGLYIHSAVYSTRGFHSPFGNSLRGIGRSTTSGCLRTPVQCAYFVYNYCEPGTLIKIVNGSPLGKTPPGLVHNTQFTDPAITGTGVELPEIILLTDIAFEQERYTIPAGEPTIIMPGLFPEDSKYNTCVWTSSDESIATVENGVVYGVSPGTARITATYTMDGSISDSCIVKVQVGNIEEPVQSGTVRLPDPYAPSTDNPLPFDEELLTLDIYGRLFPTSTLASPLIELLGESDRYSEADSCAYEGMDKCYGYELTGGDIEISTVPLLDGADTICELYVTTPAAVTTRGVRVGSTAYDVEKAYGSDFTCETVAEYGSEDCYMLLTYWAGEKNSPTTPRLSFYIDPDTLTVTAISAYSARSFG